MAVFPLLLLLFLLPILLSTAAVAKPGASQTKDETGARQLWCVAKNNADDGALQAALDWACAPTGGGVDCSPVQQGGACFEPDDLQFHASYAFNEYFRRRAADNGSCDFASTALPSQLDPVSSMAGVSPDCKFPASTPTSSGSFGGSATGPGGGSGTDPAGLSTNAAGLGRMDVYWALWASLLGLVLFPRIIH